MQAEVDGDGQASISVVQPGRYRLSFRLVSPDGNQSDSFAATTQQLTVAEQAREQGFAAELTLEAAVAAVKRLTAKKR